MHQLQGRRQILFGALFVLVATLAALSTGQSVSAKDAQKIPDYSSKAGFKDLCEAIDGTFSEDGLGNTECHYPDGGWTECDANGKDCWYTPARPAPPTGIGDGTIPSVPIVDGTEQNTAGDDQQIIKAKHHKGKKGKTHGHHRKGHKR
jgi:hypothetical protein